MFLGCPEVPINIYKTYEAQVINIGTAFVDEFVDAYSRYDFDKMTQINDDLVEAVIEASEKFLESKIA